jgi:hypothetical protein
MNHPKPAGESYVIKIEGMLSPDWVDWPYQVEIVHEMEKNGLHAITVLTLTLPDQSALYGLLEKFRDLNLKLISLQRIDLAS